ncbi:MAG: AEC family transporter, partial [Octadecabacter sp.]
LHPALVWTMGQTFDLSQDAFRSAVVTASVAPGINAYVFTNMYGAAKRVAASSVLIGTALSTLTTTLWLSVLP